MSDQAPANKTFRVTVIEWLAYTTVLQATDKDEAIEEARQLWLSRDHDDRFEFEDADLDTVIADEC
jgi:hypothetical protein